jgi:hypothetical protein
VPPWKFRSCLASLNTVRSVGAGEADTAGTEAVGAGDASRTDWAGVDGTKFSMGRKGVFDWVEWQKAKKRDSADQSSIA